MAAKNWGDYAITEIRQGMSDTKIQMFNVRKNLGKSLGSPESVHREQVITAIEQGISFVTATLDPRTNFWQLGEDVRVIQTKQGKYLRTDGNTIEADNLGSLPRF